MQLVKTASKLGNPFSHFSRKKSVGPFFQVGIVWNTFDLFADDTCLYVTVDDPNSSAAVLNNNLKNVFFGGGRPVVCQL